MTDPVIIIGGGLSGLACAIEFERSNIPYLILEASDRVGGKLKTDVVEGFLCDHGFHVYFTGYPLASKFLDHDRLDFGKFRSGARVFTGARMETIDEKDPIGSLLCGLFGILDKVQLRKLSKQMKELDPEVTREPGNESTEEFLKNYGFSAKFMESFARPFLGGIFLDRSLAVSASQFKFIWHSLASGNTVLPKEGMEAIPKQLLESLTPGRVRTYARVREVLTEGGRASGVALETSEIFQGSEVVIATDAQTLANLTYQKFTRGTKSSTTLYFETPTAIDEKAYLTLSAEPGLVNEVAPLSVAQPFYAPTGKHLVSVTLLDAPNVPDAELAQQVKQDLVNWFPATPSTLWRFIKSYRVADAQLKQPTGFEYSLQSVRASTAGLYLAGESTTNVSIDGALESGRMAAKAILNDRKARA